MISKPDVIEQLVNWKLLHKDHHCTVVEETWKQQWNSLTMKPWGKQAQWNCSVMTSLSRLSIYPSYIGRIKGKPIPTQFFVYSTEFSGEGLSHYIQIPLDLALVIFHTENPAKTNRRFLAVGYSFFFFFL